jgi:AraC family transcriptional activator of mtrCDE
MDALTRLIELARPQASLELRCLLAGNYDIDHAPEEAGQAPFHLVLAGQCSLEPARGRALVLRSGDFALFPRGGAHHVRPITGHSARGEALKPLRLGHDGLLPLRRNGRGAAELELLCGRFVYTPGPAALLLAALPDPVHVSLAGTPQADALHALVGLMREEAAQRAPGALAIVTALAQALFALALRAYAQTHAGAAGLLGLLTDARLAPSVQAMLAQPGRNWSIESLGALLDFLTQLRMSLAADMLARTRRNAGDIAAEVGYQSEAAFGKAFRQSVGTSPGRYRQAQAAPPAR